MRKKAHIVWFKRDLRAEDNAALAGAVRAAEGALVIPLYIAEPDLWAEPDMAGRHWGFIAEALDGLRADLAALGQPLVLRTGEACGVLEALRQEFGVAGLWSHQETGNGWTYRRDMDVAAWARAHDIPWHEPVQGGVVRRLPNRDGWARRFDRLMAESQIDKPAHLTPVDLDPGEIPTARDLGIADDPCPGRQHGARRAGLELLGSFLTERALPYRRAMSSPAAGAIHCSRLSPHLAWGTLSVREVMQANRARRAEVKARGERGFGAPLSSFDGRLHWRDHFIQKLEDAPRLEHENLHRGMNVLDRSPDAERLEAFATGHTGLPFVDACMRSLAATGWINFRMRAMLQATASYHLWLPWRDSGLVLARLFTDYEPGIHWSQVQMQSGTTGINTLRIYNPVKQGHDQDPDGEFIRKWVPELAGLQGRAVHEPWKDGGVDGYPDRIVDHEEAAREAKLRVYGARKGEGFRSEADRIQARHGSRRSGMRNTGTRRGKDTRQMSFDL